jgi:hypothetical protein
MKKTFLGFGCAAVLVMAGGAHAGLSTFNAPPLVTIDNDTNVATYVESGNRFSGDAASFLTLDFFGAGGTGGLYVLPGSTLALVPDVGGLFSLLSLDYAAFAFDSESADLPPQLHIHGLFADDTTQDLTLSLGDFKHADFSNFSSLKQVSFDADSAFVLDNVNTFINAVPEPSSMALVGTALTGLLFVRRRRGIPS